VKRRQQKFLSEISEVDIPVGCYCYSIVRTPNKTRRLHKNRKFSFSLNVKNCPYYKKIMKYNSQEDGYCRLMKMGDWQEDGTFLLWDGVKECGIKDNEEEPDEKQIKELKK